MNRHSSTSKQKRSHKHPYRFSILFLLISLLIAAFSIAGCKYGLEQAIYRPNGVNDRNKELKTITLPTAVTNSSVYQSKKYNFMILTDVHYGSEYDVPEQHIMNWLDKFDNSADIEPGMMHMFQMADEYLNEAHLAIERVGKHIRLHNRIEEEEALKKGTQN